MNTNSILGCLVAVLFASCGASVKTTIDKKYSALDYKQEVRVYGVTQPAPANAEKIGVVKIGDSGFSTDCDYSTVLEKAKTEARKAGGNVLKITEHIPPSAFGSSCHRIKALILKVENLNDSAFVEPVDSTLLNANYALLHVYRFGGMGGLVGYDLHLGDSVICRVKNNWKETIKIYKDGPNSLWAKTESKSEVPVNIKFGNEYYLRCSLTMGAFVGHPKIELVDKATGSAEIGSIKEKNK